MILLLTLAGLAAGAAAGSGLRPSLFGYLVLCLGLTAAGELLRCALWLFRGLAGPAALLSAAGGELLCTLIFALPVYLLYRLAWRRVGGDRLA